MNKHDHFNDNWYRYSLDKDSQSRIHIRLRFPIEDKMNFMIPFIVKILQVIGFLETQVLVYQSAFKQINGSSVLSRLICFSFTITLLNVLFLLLMI